MVLGGEPQAGGQAFAAGEQALDRGRVQRPVAGGERIDAGADDLCEFRAGRGGEAAGVEDLPGGVLDLGLHPGRDLGQDISRAMKL